MKVLSLLPQLVFPHLLIGTLLGSVLICTTACDVFLPLISTGSESSRPLVAPYPPSEVIAELSWADKDEIRRAAEGSDNWPVTWADNDHLYTAYGDGWGFNNPRPDDKLSLGYARIQNGPTDFEGVNIRSEDEQFGQGRSGKKASGMLMVEGVLYMWVRNADNNGHGCQLAFSADHAENWTWSTWTFPDFGYCTFVNFGKDYAGAIDNYVYMVTPNGPSAYDYADGFVLSRVAKNSILEQSAYEFFVELADGGPVWTDELAERGEVFSNQGRSRRNGMSYNEPLQRFIWWQGLPSPEGDERFSGGIGIYDAPAPWGPWTTVYFTPNWDVGPGDAASFPTKWISEDGLTMHLVYAGDDTFSVRQAELALID